MGTMLEEAQLIHSAEYISHQGYRRLLSRACGICVEKYVGAADGARLM